MRVGATTAPDRSGRRHLLSTPGLEGRQAAESPGLPARCVLLWVPFSCPAPRALSDRRCGRPRHEPFEANQVAGPRIASPTCHDAYAPRGGRRAIHATTWTVRHGVVAKAPPD